MCLGKSRHFLSFHIIFWGDFDGFSAIFLQTVPGNPVPRNQLFLRPAVTLASFYRLVQPNQPPTQPHLLPIIQQNTHPIDLWCSVSRLSNRKQLFFKLDSFSCNFVKRYHTKIISIKDQEISSGRHCSLKGGVLSNWPNLLFFKPIQTYS